MPCSLAASVVSSPIAYINASVQACLHGTSRPHQVVSPVRSSRTPDHSLVCLSLSFSLSLFLSLSLSLSPLRTT